jgi:hypothetical protein
MAALLGGLGWIAGWGFLDPTRIVDFDPKVGRWIAGVMALVLLGPAVGALLMLLIGGNRLPRHEVDDDGIALWRTDGSIEIPWSKVRAAGVSYKLPPKSGSTFRTRNGVALEVFLSDPDLETAYPEVGRLLCRDTFPDGLPEARVRYRLYENFLTRSLDHDLAPYLGDRWLGVYERPWSRRPWR